MSNVPPVDGERPDTRVYFEGKGRTRQSMKDECDINRILGRFKQSGMITHVAQRSPVYADVSDVTDYREAVERVERTDEFFQGLPAKVRAKFGHDPVSFLDFMSDPGNEAEARDLGLLPPLPEKEAVPPVPAAG